jgi:guanylate kinase
MLSTPTAGGDAQPPIQSVIICGPSGVGKGSLISMLLQQHPQRYALSVSHTSRPPRNGEVDGVHYHFVSKEQLLKDIAHGQWKYLENAEVHGNVYGTREDDVLSIHSQGMVCVLDVDTRGVRQLKRSGFPLRSIFIAPPSIEVLEARLRGRGTEREEQIATRTANAKEELKFGLESGQFDRVIVNDNLKDAYQRLLEQLEIWFPVNNANNKTTSSRLQ